MTGSVINALDDSAAAHAAFRVDDTVVGRAEASGMFTVGFPAVGLNRAVLTASGFVERQTGIPAPGSSLHLSLIPTGFDLASFDEMFRHSPAGLTRWRSAPALLIERRVFQFRSVSADTYEPTGESLTAEEAGTLAADMLAGYALLTDGRLGPISSVRVQESEAGGPVTPRRDRTIVVTRHAGLTAATGYWGYARWSTTPDGEVTSAIILLDRDFDHAAGPHRASVRKHELGHALGCHHVTNRASVMNSHARNEPNAFDRQAARLAALRPTGNRTPDIDPVSQSATAAARSGQALTWHGAH
ncbi:MAG: hypothetical protein WD690_12245 [Vicinamibacterales bacterium]